MGQPLRPESRVLHTHGLKDLSLHVLAERLFGDGLENQPGPVDGAAVAPALPGRKVQGRREASPIPFEVGGEATDLSRPLYEHWIGKVVAQAHGVSEEQAIDMSRVISFTFPRHRDAIRNPECINVLELAVM